MHFAFKSKNGECGPHQANIIILFVCMCKQENAILQCLDHSFFCSYSSVFLCTSYFLACKIGIMLECSFSSLVGNIVQDCTLSCLVVFLHQYTAAHIHTHSMNFESVVIWWRFSWSKTLSEMRAKRHRTKKKEEDCHKERKWKKKTMRIYKSSLAITNGSQ